MLCEAEESGMDTLSCCIYEAEYLCLHSFEDIRDLNDAEEIAVQSRRVMHGHAQLLRL